MHFQVRLTMSLSCGLSSFRLPRNNVSLCAFSIFHNSEVTSGSACIDTPLNTFMFEKTFPLVLVNFPFRIPWHCFSLFSIAFSLLFPSISLFLCLLSSVSGYHIPPSSVARPALQLMMGARGVRCVNLIFSIVGANCDLCRHRPS